MASDPLIAWNDDANFLPLQAFETHRELLIHQTGPIKGFLTPGRHNHKTILVAPKGYGKTLLLAAKHRLTQHSDPECKCLPGDSVDQPSGLFPKGESLRWLLNLEYRHWVDIWRICISLYVIKSGYTGDELREVRPPHGWYRTILDDKLYYTSATAILGDLLARTERHFFEILDNYSFLSPLLQAIDGRIAVFMDAVDVYFDSILDLPAADAHDRRTRAWTLGQIGLATAAVQLTSQRFTVFCSVRREAFLQYHTVSDSRYMQIVGKTLEISYTTDDLTAIFHKNIRLMHEDSLMDPASDDPITAFVGRDNLYLEAPYANENKEPFFQCVLRHTLHRPRELMIIGSAIAQITPRERTSGLIRDKIVEASRAIVDQVYAEMRPLLPLPAIDKIPRFIQRNVMTSEDVKGIADEYSRRESDITVDPIAALYKIGLIGTVRATGQDRMEQRFILPTEIEIDDNVFYPTSEYYLLHPPLDSYIERVDSRFSRNYHRPNILGHGLRWNDPAAVAFVLKGDMCGFSTIMNTELYSVVSDKLHEWLWRTCENLQYAEILEGDSVLMIDPSPSKITEAARRFVKLAEDFKETKLRMRFGGAAGPIHFKVKQRKVNGNVEAITYPMGLALRTSARLEPHAKIGHALIEEKFHDNGIEDSHYLGRDDQSALEAGPLQVRGLAFDNIDKKFVVQKSKMDPYTLTKLWLFKLTDRGGGESDDE